MSRKSFTEEERRILLDNPYTMHVTEHTLVFTLEFKQLFWDDYRQGMLGSEIMKKYGYDPEMLGKKRIDGIKSSIKKSVMSGKGFSNIYNPVPKYSGTDKEQSLYELRQLEDKVDYLEQEIEYLKKISSIKISGK